MTTLDDLKIVASATIEKYAKPPAYARSGKVRPRSAIDQRPIVTKPKKLVGSSKNPKRFRADPTTKGKPQESVCVSFPIDELDWLDAMAVRCQTSRSHFIRQAVKHFGAKIFPDGKLK